MDEGGAEEIAGRCRGTPRIANRLLRRVRDFAEVRAAGRITRAVAQEALQMLGVDAQGLDEVDRNLMIALLDKYAGGPVGLAPSRPCSPKKKTPSKRCTSLPHADWHD